LITNIVEQLGDFSFQTVTALSSKPSF